MNTAFYTASTGVIYLQKSMDITANNLANAETPGFKTSVPSFSSLLYTNIHRGADEMTNGLKVGHGVKLSGTTVQMVQGQMMPTDRELDFAIEGEGFFAVENQLGERYYTRAGNFLVKLEDEDAYLVTTTGDYVLGPDEERVQLNAEGETQPNLTNMQARIGIYTFPNKYALIQEGANRFSATELAGEPELGGGHKLTQGFLETSNTEMSKEMVDIIVTQRAFQFSARVVQVADELESIVNNLR